MRTSFHGGNSSSGYDVENATMEQWHSQFCPPYSKSTDEGISDVMRRIFTCVMFISMAIVSAVANLFILLAMRRVTSLRLPSKLLLCSLVLTDLLAGLTVQPLIGAMFSFRLFSPADQTMPLELARYLYVIAASLHYASMLSVIAIGIDRYFPLIFPLSYLEIITTRRVLAWLVFLWSTSVLYGSSYLWNRTVYYAVLIGGILFTFLISSVVYAMIFRILHSQQVEPHDPQPAVQQVQPAAQWAQPAAQPVQPVAQPSASMPASRHEKSASTMLWIYVIFIACYLPHVTVYIVIAVVGCTPRLLFIRQICSIPVALNSCINPFVYCYRLRDVRRKVVEQLQDIIYCCTE